MQVKKQTLLAIAGVFWFVAGVNVVVVGVRAFCESAHAWWATALIAIGMAVTFLVFFLRIFKPYAAKHAARIDAMSEERTSVANTMDRKGYMMIVFMIALGAGLRLSGIVPSWFIAFFYVGLGAALALTGVLFLIDWRRRTDRVKFE